jgi:hypothetical protein
LKAELFSSDFIISIMIFLSVLIIVGAYYDNFQTDIYEYSVRSDIHSKLMNIADILGASSGEPQFWNSSNVKVVGLYDDGQFNLTKFSELKKIDYDTAKILIGTGAYELYLVLKNETGNVIDSFGMSIANAENVVSIKRLGLVEIEGKNKKAIMEVILWR